MYIIKMHSYIDIITNSSSELYICDKDKSVDFIKNTVIAICSNYGIEFDNIFEPLYVITEDNIDSFIRKYVIGWGALPRGCNFKPKTFWDIRQEVYKKYPDIDYPINNILEECDKVIEEECNKIKQDTSIVEQLLGCVCLFSNDDNSIPYDIMSDIECCLLVNNFHLG